MSADVIGGILAVMGVFADSFGEVGHIRHMRPITHDHSSRRRIRWIVMLGAIVTRLAAAGRICAVGRVGSVCGCITPTTVVCD